MKAQDLLAQLTPGEREVLSLIVAGHANKEIADRLGIRVRTAETHRLRCRDKTNPTSLSGLIRLTRVIEPD